MVKIKIHAVHGNIVAFNVGFELYYLKFLPIPQLFDEHLKLQIVYNFDSWFQAKTHQRYSFQTFQDMVDAFRQAIESTYSRVDLEKISARAALYGKEFVFTRKMSEYRKFFWIELIDPASLESNYAEVLRTNLDKFKEQLGEAELINRLRRFHKLAYNYHRAIAAIFEKLLERLGATASEPTFPETNELDRELMQYVAHKMSTDRELNRALPPRIHAALEILNQGAGGSAFG